MRVLKTASEMRLLRHRSASLRDLALRDLLAVVDSASGIRPSLTGGDHVAGTYYWGKEKRTYFNVTEIENGKKVYKRCSTREIRPRTEWIEVQVPDSGIPPETIARARERVESNVAWKPSNNDGLTWELSGGVAVCGECDHRLRTCNQSNAKRKRYRYYSCPQAKDKCSHTKLHRKEELEQKVGERLADTIEDSTWESLVNRTLDQKVRDLEDMRRGAQER